MRADKRLSVMGAWRGFVINTLRKKTFLTGAVRKDAEFMCSVVLQLSLLLLANFNSSWVITH